MLNPTRVFELAGAGNTHVPICAWLDDHTFLTKKGDVGVVLKIDAVDYESIAPETRDNIAERLQQAVRSLRSPFRVIQYMFKRAGVEIPTAERQDRVVQATVDARANFLRSRSDSFYSIDLYYVLLYTGAQQESGLAHAAGLIAASMGKKDEESAMNRARGWAELGALFSDRKEARLVKAEVDAARERLKHATQTFALACVNFTSCSVLGQKDAAAMLRRLLNPNYEKTSVAPTPYMNHADIWLNTANVEDHDDHLVIDGYHVRILTLRGDLNLPKKSRPLIFKALAEVDGNFHTVLDWCGLEHDAAKKEIKKARAYFKGSAVPLFGAMMSSGAGPAEGVDADESKLTWKDQCDALQAEIENNGRVLGHLTLTVIVYDRDPKAAATTARKIYAAFSEKDASLVEETYGLTNTFYSTLPGNHERIVRDLPLVEYNHADLSFLFSLSSGSRVNSHIGDEYLAALETNQKTLYWMNLHYYDIGHTLILGSTGMGKSFLMNFLITCLMKYRPYMTIFGLGQDYAGLAKVFGGTYFRIGFENEFRINPFAMPPTTTNKEFLLKFVTLLLSNNDPEYTCSLAEQRELREAIANIYALDPGLRTLSVYRTLIPRHLADNLDRWTAGGPYADLFDNAVDSLAVNDFQVLDFEGMDAHPEVLDPLLMFFLHRFSAILHDPKQARRLKVIPNDELWRIAKHPIVVQEAINVLNLGRKRNAMMLMATHSIEQLGDSPLLTPMLANCPTTIFLPNEKLDRALYKERFRLHDGEIDCIAHLQPKKQFFFRQPNVGKVLSLNVDPRSYWIYANNAKDNARRDDAIAKYGFEQALDFLAAGNA